MCLQLRQWALNTTPAHLLRLVQVLVLCVGTELFWGGRRVGAELAGRVSHGSGSRSILWMLPQWAPLAFQFEAQGGNSY